MIMSVFLCITVTVIAAVEVALILDYIKVRKNYDRATTLLAALFEMVTKEDEDNNTDKK